MSCCLASRVVSVSMVDCVCENCGNAFTVFPSLRARGGGRFCSLRCKGAWETDRPLVPLEERLWSRVDRSGDCWLWTGCRAPTGYGRIGLTRGRVESTHRVAYELARGPIPPGAFVLHSCDNRLCCNPAHLRLGDVQDNADDMTSRVRQARGERHGSSKLNRDDVKLIRRAVAGGASVAAVAQLYGVGARTVYDIRLRKTWAWLE
jgi:hypothetical protein